MKRALVLLALVTLVIWLAHGASSNDKKQPTRALSVHTTTAPQPQSDPCGGGCDPDGSLELACFNAGGLWDPYTCYCDPSCDPFGDYEAYCYEIGGTWDPATCYCQAPTCNPGPEVVTYESQPWDCSYCDGSYYYPCNCVDKVYTRFCQDGSVYSERPQGAQSCAFPEPPPNACDSGGGGGGGGGGGDCWDDPSCSCDYYGYCCDWDYCYTF